MATFTVPTRTTKTKTDLNSTQSLVDPEWELIDPIPDIHHLFQTFNNKFFVGKLACVELEWSKRMYQCAGICYSRGNRFHMACVIRLSEPLLKLRSRKELIETLLHEMIHAWNFIRGVREENGGHGPQFLSKMTEINHLAGTNITVYHTFYDEVELYKTHWWRCDGPCRERKPFYGYVKRTSNRAPSKNDLWWGQHLSTCGGTFIKVKEPEKKAKKKAEPRKAEAKSATTKKPAAIEAPKPSSSGDIRKFFSPNVSPVRPTSSTPSSSVDSDSSFDENINNTKKKELEEKNGNVVGGSGSGRSRLLDTYGNDSTTAAKKRKLSSGLPTISLVSPPPPPPPPRPQPSAKPVRTSIIQLIKNEFGEDDDDIIFIDDEFDDTVAIQSLPAHSTDGPPIKVEPKEEGSQDFCNCPVCNEKVKNDAINQHLDECLTMQFLK